MHAATNSVPEKKIAIPVYQYGGTAAGCNIHVFCRGIETSNVLDLAWI